MTSSFPYGPGEGFLVAEVEELIRQGNELTIVPTLARGPVVHEDVRRFLPLVERERLLSPSVLASAAGEARRSPRQLFAALAPVRHSRNAVTLAKNGAVLPKALWLAARVRELAVEHIHVHWGGTSSTLAMIAADLAGVTWSLTAHRWDIRENNLLRVKANSASFVRTISEDGLRDLERIVGHARAPRHVLHMGVALPDRPGRARKRPVGEPLHVLMPANFLEVKGHRFLVDAIAILRSRDTRVVVELAGSGPLRNEIVRHAAAAGLESEYVFLGQLSHSVLLKSMGAGRWDAVVLASIETDSGEKEGIPVALLEAMSYGYRSWPRRSEESPNCWITARDSSSRLATQSRSLTHWHDWTRRTSCGNGSQSSGVNESSAISKSRRSSASSDASSRRLDGSRVRKPEVGSELIPLEETPDLEQALVPGPLEVAERQ